MRERGKEGERERERGREGGTGKREKEKNILPSTNPYTKKITGRYNNQIRLALLLALASRTANLANQLA